MGHLRRTLAAFTATAMTVAAAWAGVGLAPVPDQAVHLGAGASQGAAGTGMAAQAFAALQGAELGEGLLEVGASKVSLYPRPDLYEDEFPGATWLQDLDACATLSPSLLSATISDPEHGAHIATATANPWPENPDCLYSGGFDIGPMNPIIDWDRAPGDPGYEPDEDPETGYGLWARSIVLSDGTDELVLTIIDAEGFFWDYATKCDGLGPERADCGARGIAQTLGTELGIDPANFVIAATHAHAAPDLIGGWGFVPDWYMAQVVDAIKQSVREAHARKIPAHLEVGEELARGYNSERRDTYRAAEEQNLAWFRAVDAADPRNVVATVGAYAGHPTSYNTNDNVAHADWVGVFERRLEDNFGGVGFHFMTGLGNMSNRTGRTGAGQLADLVPPVGSGHVLSDTDVRAAQATWDQPVTNAPLTALGLPGFFDRQFNPTPAALRTGENPDTAPCVSSAPYSVQLAATGARIGDDLALSAAPGEVFSNLTNTVKEQSGARVTMPFGQANDALGYMPQEFELNEVGQQGLGFAVSGVLVVNYEDSYAIDRCTGDHVLETTIELLNGLREQ